MATGTLLSRLTGLLRVGALAWAVGGGSLADAYNLANTTPNIVYELLLGGILSATIVPIFVRQAEARDERSTSAVFTITLTVLRCVHARGDGMHTAHRPPVLDQRQRRGASRGACTSSRC